jgi:hypothetical protein
VDGVGLFQYLLWFLFTPDPALKRLLGMGFLGNRRLDRVLILICSLIADSH